MRILTMLPLAALVASIVLLLHNAHRVLAIIALAVSGVEVVLAFGLVHFGVRGLPLGLIFGATLAVVGAVLFLRVHHKNAVAAATVIALVGVLQLLTALHV
jgi:hypothetical protein